MPAPRSLAERCRAHREEMTLALELGCTPREARTELDRRAAWARLNETRARIAAAQRARARPTPTEAYQAQQRLLGERDD